MFNAKLVDSERILKIIKESKKLVKENPSLTEVEARKIVVENLAKANK